MATDLEYATLSRECYEPNGGNLGQNWQYLFNSDELDLGFSFNTRTRASGNAKEYLDAWSA